MLHDKRVEIINHVGVSMSQNRVAICGVARTPIGSFLGTLSPLSATHLGIKTVEELCRRVGVDVSSGIIDEVLFGQVLQAGSGQNPARQVALGAGLPVTTSATTINKVCGSSLEAAMLASSNILAGKSKVVIAGGMESMSNAPQLLMGQRKGKKMGDSQLIDSLLHDGLWDVYNDIHMGNTGEIVAQECNITRNESDEFAAQSHARAAKAWKKGWFDWETFTVKVPQRRVEDLLFSRDEGVKPDTSVEVLAKLKPVFDNSGQVTAGNASTLNDGASAILLADES